jgi:alpha-mannosidase
MVDSETQRKYEMSLVAETHWDREWYSTFQEFRFRLVKMMDKLLDILDTTPYANFFLDGQTCPLDDYIEIRPENCMKALDYVKKGRLSIGPSYILPDMFLVSGEAHIRNLLLGHKMAKDWGVSIHKVGYEPDAFGHIAQMPQILQGFGISNYIFHRGLGDEAETIGSEFWWDSPDGSRVLAQYLPHGYGNLADLLHDDALDKVYADAKARVLREREFLASRTRTRRLLLMNGVDHLEPERDIPRFIERFNKENEGIIIHRTMEEHCTLQYQDLFKLGDSVPVWKGEFHYGKEHPILTDTSSARIYLKQMNAYLENLLENWADPINAIASVFGGKNENPGYLWYAWKSLIQNHPHDSICGCSVDEVHEEMLGRFKKTEEIANIQIARALTDIAKHISYYPKEMPLNVNNLVENVPIIVFNPLPYPIEKTIEVYMDFRETDIFDKEDPMPPEVFEIKDPDGNDIPYMIEEVVLDSIRKTRYQGRTFELQFMARVPAMGYTVYHLSPSDNEDWPEYPVAPEFKATELSIENQFVKLEFAANGTFTLTEKGSGNVFPNCHLFIDEADWGDEYDFVPLTGDKYLTTIDSEAILSLGQYTPYSVSFLVDINWELPEALLPDRSKRSPDTNEIFIHSEITLYANNPVVQIRTEIDNTCEDHRLRVVFPTGLKDVKCLAKEPFHVQERPMVLPKAEKWQFKPTGSDHTEGYTTLENGQFQFSVFNKGLPNYEVGINPLPEILAAPCIIQTLFRAVGWLGHPSVVLPDGRHKGGAGPTMKTVDSQMIGTYAFEYAVYPSPGDYKSAQVPKVFQNWVVNLGCIIPYDVTDPYNLIPFPQKLSFYYQMNTPKPVPTDHALPNKFSFMELFGQSIEYSTLKVAEDGSGLILRIWNSDRNLQDAKIVCGKLPNKAILVNLEEKELNDQGRISLGGTILQITKIKPSEIISIKLFF